MPNAQSKGVSYKMKLKERKFKFTENQIKFLKTALDEEIKLLFLAGPAGTAKTYMAVYSALQLMLNSDMEKSILYIRSVAESGQKSLGALPGTLEEKFAVYAGPLYDKLDEMMNINDIKFLENSGYIEAMPVNYVRGANWTDKVVIVDEAQNLSKKELVTILTRIGEGSKIIICGDVLQSDIPNGGFVEIFNLFNDSQSEEKGVKSYSFNNDDIMRSEMLRYIVAKLEGEYETASKRSNF
jgi:phosphate starvation-inducible PhoH-like protein